MTAALTFIGHGIRHILDGADHVLFVLCLIIGALGLGNLLWRVTGFTIGHTVTLVLGFYGFVPQGDWFIPAVEVGIALSIIYAAVIAVMRRPARGTVLITGLIGLLHGLGFSFILREILRLDAPNLWHSLLSFNLGVEIGQVAIVLGVWPVIWWLGKRGEKPLRIARWVIALPCAAAALWWTLERSQGLLTAL